MIKYIHKLIVSRERSLKMETMTNKQFNGFIRFVKDMLEEVENEKDKEKKDKKLRRVIDNLQQTLED